MLAAQQEGQQDDSPELFNLLRFAAACLALGIFPDEVDEAAQGYLSGLHDLRRQGVLRLEDLTQVYSRDPEHVERWAAGFAAGYLSAWAMAVLRVLDRRDVVVDNHVLRALDLCPDADLLTRFLDRAVTAARKSDPVVGEAGRGAPGGS
ncbi:hypothetical protein ACQEWB_29015 [Streptomyces sp. CA-249302]|uniref:hypothetical protein n=1 Tax=Streptomyces sp. CA-249302 TaxID=3240058 RepID=UPI003D94328D